MIIASRHMTGACLMVIVCGCSLPSENSSSVGAESNLSAGSPNKALDEERHQPEVQAAVRLRDLNVAYSIASERFGDELVLAETRANPVDEAKKRWEGRLAGCADQTCRDQVIRDQSNRLKFAEGLADAPIPGVPWPNGLFKIRDPAFEGSLSIFPLIDNELLIRVDTSQRPDASWICTIIALGRLSADGTALMTSLDDEARTFSVRRGSAGEVILAPATGLRDEPDPCYPTGIAFGTYSIASPTIQARTP